ncbi:hypothetical protein NLI96_g12364 [Meripilus lineatus]|uniref:Histone-lysine N-methyltransferase, H3 lysine-79 specific n=1 Tax=Meripilus lineatus TaxID=2056292 RepID=A0AAD5YCG7_9APHY|nr:hypothetical protein NLI96_g12364 [Physisporinus lineatus]
MGSYKAFFKNRNDPTDRSFDPHPTDYPVVELEYPNTYASERFILLAPKDDQHYNPINDLESSLHTIVQYYLTPEQRELFGPLPDATLLDITDETPSDSSPQTVPVDSPSPATVSSTPYSVSSPSACSDTSVSSISSTSSVSSTLSSLTSLSSISDLIPASSSTAPSQPPTINFLRLLRRAKSQHDGPQFLKVMDGINALLRSFKYPILPQDPFEPTPPNYLRDSVRTWSDSGSVPRSVLQRIIEETYQRVVGPHTKKLNTSYTAFSSQTYGELMPSFVSEIIKETRLGVPHSTSDPSCSPATPKVFLDLGSGVGNVVLQVSLETGCKSFGIEIQPLAAGIAREQLEQFKTRCRMWGVRMGDVELEEGDMLKSKRVDELIAKADVVLINNKVFEGALNEAIKPKFLDLKEGAMVVSLQSFVTTGRGSERNINDISAIFKHYTKEYYSGSVSWGSGGGQYYIHEVDRVGCMAANEALAPPTRSMRSRR